jgi:hypothetical protein
MLTAHGVTGKLIAGLVRDGLATVQAESVQGQSARRRPRKGDWYGLTFQQIQKYENGPSRIGASLRSRNPFCASRIQNSGARLVIWSNISPLVTTDAATPRARYA